MPDHMALLEQHQAYIDKSVALAARRLVVLGCCHHQELGDLCQELWLQVIRSVPAYDAAKGKFPTFLATVLRRRGLNILRRLSRVPRTESLDEDVPDGEGGLMSRSALLSNEEYARRWQRHYRPPLEQAELAADVQVALHGLSFTPRQLCLELAAGERANVTATARMRGCSRSAIHRQRDRIREHLDACGLRNFLQRT